MEKFNWENPEIFKINKEDGHAIMMPFDSEKDALSAKESNYKQSLNGKWKFYWQRGLKNQPENFQLTSFDDSHWDEINVPSVWQTQGYSVLTIMQVHFLRLSVAQKEKFRQLTTICRKSVFTENRLLLTKISMAEKYFFILAPLRAHLRFM